VGEYYADILVENVLMVELECGERKGSQHTAQCLSDPLCPGSLAPLTN